MQTRVSTAPASPRSPRGSHIDVRARQLARFKEEQAKLRQEKIQKLRDAKQGLSEELIKVASGTIGWQSGVPLSVKDCVDAANEEIFKQLDAALTSHDDGFWGEHDQVKLFFQQTKGAIIPTESRPELEKILDVIYRNFDAFSKADEIDSDVTVNSLTESLRAFISEKQKELFQKIAVINEMKSGGLAKCVKRDLFAAAGVRGLDFNTHLATKDIAILSPRPTVQAKPAAEVSPDAIGDVLMGSVKRWLSSEDGRVEVGEIRIPNEYGRYFDNDTLYMLTQLRNPSGGRVVVTLESRNGGENKVVCEPREELQSGLIDQRWLKGVLLNAWNSPMDTSYTKASKVSASIDFEKNRITDLTSMRAHYTPAQQRLFIGKMNRAWREFESVLRDTAPMNDDTGAHIHPTDTTQALALNDAAKVLSYTIEKINSISDKTEELNTAIKEIYGKMERVKFEFPGTDSKGDALCQQYLLAKNPYTNISYFRHGAKEKCTEATKVQADRDAVDIDKAFKSFDAFVREGGLKDTSKYEFVYDRAYTENLATQGMLAVALGIIGGNSKFLELGGELKDLNGKPFKVLGLAKPSEPEQREGMQRVHDNIDLVMDVLVTMDKKEQAAFVAAYCHQAKDLFSQASGNSLNGIDGARLGSFHIVSALETKLTAKAMEAGGRSKRRLDEIVVEVLRPIKAEIAEENRQIRVEQRAKATALATTLQADERSLGTTRSSGSSSRQGKTKMTPYRRAHSLARSKSRTRAASHKTGLEYKQDYAAMLYTSGGLADARYAIRQALKVSYGSRTKAQHAALKDLMTELDRSEKLTCLYRGTETIRGEDAARALASASGKMPFYREDYIQLRDEYRELDSREFAFTVRPPAETRLYYPERTTKGRDRYVSTAMGMVDSGDPMMNFPIFDVGKGKAIPRSEFNRPATVGASRRSRPLQMSRDDSDREFFREGGKFDRYLQALESPEKGAPLPTYKPVDGSRREIWDVSAIVRDYTEGDSVLVATEDDPYVTPRGAARIPNSPDSGLQSSVKSFLGTSRVHTFNETKRSVRRNSVTTTERTGQLFSLEGSV